MRRPDRRSTPATSRAWRSAGASRFTAQPTLLRASSPRRRSPTPTRSTSQDLRSNVFALDRSTGALRWARRYHAPERRPERSRRHERRCLRRDRLGRVPPRRRHRGGALAPAPDGCERAVRRHRAGGVGGPRVRQHARLPADRARCDLRARRGDGRGAVEVRDGQGAVAFPLEAGGGGALESGLGRLAGSALRGQLEPGAVGRHAGAAERRDLSRARAVHRLAPRARRAHRAVALVRPGDSARRSGLRLPGDAGSRDARRSRRRVRRRERRDG